MDKTELTVEALKLTLEWSKWLVGIDIATVAGVFSFAFKQSIGIEVANITIEKGNRRENIDTYQFVMAGALLLLLSAAWASTVLIGAADVILQVISSPGHPIFEYTVPFPFPGPISVAMPLWIPLSMQNSCFGLGMLVYLFYFGSIVREAPRIHN
jgi:hypothetical protein